jgi:hypothetical protein
MARIFFYASSSNLNLVVIFEIFVQFSNITLYLPSQRVTGVPLQPSQHAARVPSPHSLLPPQLLFFIFFFSLKLFINVSLPLAAIPTGIYNLHLYKAINRSKILTQFYKKSEKKRREERREGGEEKAGT